jgi:hypothetical protein
MGLPSDSAWNWWTQKRRHPRFGTPYPKAGHDGTPFAVNVGRFPWECGANTIQINVGTRNDIGVLSHSDVYENITYPERAKSLLLDRPR